MSERTLTFSFLPLLTFTTNTFSNSYREGESIHCSFRFRPQGLIRLFMPLKGVEPSLFHERQETKDDRYVHPVLPYFQLQRENVLISRRNGSFSSSLLISRTYAPL